MRWASRAAVAVALFLAGCGDTTVETLVPERPRKPVDHKRGDQDD